jgi:hypothetical protein
VVRAVQVCQWSGLRAADQFSAPGESLRVVVCVIRWESATDSDAIPPPIPTEVGRPFRLEPATL